jgi:hypothetical protein
MRATITLKEGASYHLEGYVFTTAPQEVTDPEIISKARQVGVLSVAVREDAPLPAPALKAAPPMAAKKPGPPPKVPTAAKPTPKPAQAKPSAPASAPADDKED